MLEQGMDIASSSLTQGLLAWMSPKASAIGEFGDFVFFKFVLDRLQHDIRVFGENVLGRMMDFISIVAIAALTTWVFLQGYKVISGQQRESMMGLTVTALKATFIVSIALSFGAANDAVTGYLTQDMPSGINQLITGNNGPPSEEIDENLGWMQVAMSSIDALDSGGDLAGNMEKDRAQTLIGLGTGGPAITAGALLLMYQVAMALFIGLGPLFILCLLFEFTKGLFSKWLFYGIGTMFSMAVLSAMVSIALSMVTDVAAALWASDAINTLILNDGGASGYTSRALQAGSMGMILTLLLITVPPMAANFFSGTLGQFTWVSAFGGAAAGSMGPGGQAPGTTGYQPSSVSPYAMGSREEAPSQGDRGVAHQNGRSTHPVVGTSQAQGSGAEDGIKSGSLLRGQEPQLVGAGPALQAYQADYARSASGQLNASPHAPGDASARPPRKD